MPTLRRSLKYMPAAVLGLLVVAWVASVFFPFGVKVTWPNGDGHYRLMFAMAEISLQSTNSFDWPTEVFWDRRYWSIEDGLLGRQHLLLHNASEDEWYDGRGRSDTVVGYDPLALRHRPLPLLPLPPLALLGIHGARRPRTRLLLAVAGIGGFFAC